METNQQSLSALFRDLSMQLRNSLSTAHLAISQLVPASQRKQNQKIDAQAAVLDQSYHRLLRLSQDLSALADLTSGTPPALQDCDLVDLIQDLCLQAESYAAFLGLKFRFLCDLDPQICAVRQDQIQRLFFHLLSNAFKYTPAGGSVTVELRRSGQRLLLSVQDTGCGIDPARMDSLFDRRPPSDLLNPPPIQSGLGLGLPLCRAIAAAHEGSIMAESHPGQGPRVTFSLPIRQGGTPTVSDIYTGYVSGFSQSLTALSDALPARAFFVNASI